MAEFISYFFGQGETKEFHYFSLAHILPILFMLGVITLIIVFRKKIQEYKHEDRIRLTLGFIMIITEMSYFWRLVGVESLNANPVDHLPITVCGWAIIFSSFLVLTKNKTLFDIVYFWVFAGSTFGLLTPTVITYCGPTRFRYYQFWLEHIMGFITIFYMMYVHKMRPNWKSFIKALCAMFILGGIAIFANLNLPGANYLFMAMPEETASILDILPKNYVLRVIVMALAITLLFFIAYLPWFIKDIKAKKRNALATVETTEYHATAEVSPMPTPQEEMPTPKAIKSTSSKKSTTKTTSPTAKSTTTTPTKTSTLKKKSATTSEAEITSPVKQSTLTPKVRSATKKATADTKISITESNNTTTTKTSTPVTKTVKTSSTTNTTTTTPKTTTKKTTSKQQSNTSSTQQMSNKTQTLKDLQQRLSILGQKNNSNKNDKNSA